MRARPGPSGPRIALLARWGLLGLLLALAPPSHAAERFWTARAATLPRVARGYAEVVPRAILRLRAGTAGRLAGLAVAPGDRIAAGAVLGRLEGAPVAAMLARRRAALAVATARLAASRQQLAIVRGQERTRLATRADAIRAELAVRDAAAGLDAARADLRAAERSAELHAPSAGRVLRLAAAPGELLAAGETVLTLLPDAPAWLRVALYGAEAGSVRVGMTGRFQPADGGAPVPLRVRAVAAMLDRDGARIVFCEPQAGTAAWTGGEAGGAAIDLGVLRGVAVPTRALILDRGHWFVLVRTPKGTEPRRVTPGPRTGAMTLVLRGLAPGEAIVVDGAYLAYHGQAGMRFQAPD